MQRGSQMEVSLTSLAVARVGSSDLRSLLWERVTYKDLSLPTQLNMSIPDVLLLTVFVPPKHKTKNKKKEA